MTKTDDDVEFISTATAARRFGISAPTIRKRIREGLIPARAEGSKYLVEPAAVRAYINSLPSEPILPARDA